MSAYGKAIDRLISGESLPYEEALQLMLGILEGSPTEMEQGAFLCALTAKGPSMDELAAVREAILLSDTVKVHVDADRALLDNCGTGMDKIKTFNVSTAAAIVASSLGAVVARHGSRALSSACGTVDVSEALGIGVEVPPEAVKKSVESIGLGLFNGSSPLVHPKALGRILSCISFGSVLNISASLANPAEPKRAVRGVHSLEMVESVARLLSRLSYERAIVVHGLDGCGNSGMDEASIVGSTSYALLSEGSVQTGTFEPTDFGLPYGDIKEILSTKDPKREALRILSVLEGKATMAETGIVALNSALALFISDIASSIREGVEMSMEAMASGQALRQFERWRAAQPVAYGQESKEAIAF